MVRSMAQAKSDEMQQQLTKFAHMQQELAVPLKLSAGDAGHCRILDGLDDAR